MANPLDCAPTEKDLSHMKSTVRPGAVPTAREVVDGMSYLVLMLSLPKQCDRALKLSVQQLHTESALSAGRPNGEDDDTPDNRSLFLEMGGVANLCILLKLRGDFRGLPCFDQDDLVVARACAPSSGRLAAICKAINC